MSTNYKDFTIVQGQTEMLPFTLTGNDYLPLPLAGKTIYLAIFDSSQNLLLSKHAPVTTDPLTGGVTFILSAEETKLLPDGNLYYRVMAGSSSSAMRIQYRGFLTCEVPEFLEDSLGWVNGSAAGGNVITLADGTLYALSPVTVQSGVWYALNSFYHFEVSGNGAITIDGRDLAGSIFGNIAAWVFNETSPVTWPVSLQNKTAFRINIASGGTNVVVKYMP